MFFVTGRDGTLLFLPQKSNQKTRRLDSLLCMDCAFSCLAQTIIRRHLRSGKVYGANAFLGALLVDS